jgi:hypothetical protein
MHDLMDWLQNSLGKTAAHDSWSQQLLGSLNFWGLLEGTHLLTLMIFAGTIMLVDLRMLGVTFKKTPYSEVSAKFLPLTVTAFGILVVTGSLLYFANPVVYFHNLWFRFKMVFLVLAMANLVFFHFKTQKSQAIWDASEKPPLSVRMSAAISIAAWLLVIGCGRFIPYSWYNCGTPQGAFTNAVQACAQTPYGAVPLEISTVKKD